MAACCSSKTTGWCSPVIVTRLDRVLADRKVSSRDLALAIGLSEVNLSRIKTGKVSAMRFSTLEALCRELKCQPGDLLEYLPDETAGYGGGQGA